MVSTRRTKRPSFGEPAAAPQEAPATPATRSKRPRAANATPNTARVTPARGKQQSSNNRTRASKGEKGADVSPPPAAAADVIRDNGRSEQSTNDVDEHNTVADIEQQSEESQVEKPSQDAGEAIAAAEVAELSTAEEVATNEVQTDETAQEAAKAQQAAEDRVGEVEADEDVVSDVNTVQADGDDEDDGDDDGVDEDDEYNFDVDHEPLSPPPASLLDDEDDDNLRAKEGRQRAAPFEDDDDDGTAGSSTKFGATLSALLHQPTASLASPLLAAAPLLPIPRDPTAAADRALRLKQRARREWRERAHRTDVQYDEVERRLVRVATRGVVQLFNAVQQQRRAGRMQAASEEKDRADIAGKSKRAEMSKEGFMQLIRTAPRVEQAEEHKVGGRQGGERKGAREGKSGGWSVLKDDYMLGGKLTDWDKQIDESEEEEEVEAQEEMEVE